MDVLDVAEKLWVGELDVTDVHPWSVSGEAVEVADRTVFVANFANVSAFATDEGLLLVDTGSPFTAASVHDRVRRWSDLPLHTAVFSHGHIDHVFGVGPFEEEARRPRPRVIAHEAMPARFARYRSSAGWNAHINRRQFGVDELEWPVDYREPDATYGDRLDLDVGGELVELHHARGETDDHTWTWFPQRRVLCPGDLFIWATPNAGNPQKVQRYPREWAAALRDMVSVGPEVLLPGHGVPIVGADRIRGALTDAADLLDHLHDETLRLMNEGADLDTIVHTVRAPQHLLDRPYLKPIYDEPEFIVRTVWRFFGGWWDGDPSTLKPARNDEVARELATLAGGAERLAARAEELAAAGELRLACHLVEVAGRAAADDESVLAVRRRVYEQRAAQELSTMSKGVYTWAARR